MSDTKKVVALVGFDNRLPITSDISSQLMLALSNGMYTCAAVTTTILVRSTMMNPTGGTAEIILSMLVPSGEMDAAVAAIVSAVLSALTLPFCPTFTISSITVFDAAAEPTPGPPQPGQPENGNP